MPIHQIILTLWALENVLLQQPLTDAERAALVNAALKTIIANR